MMIMKCFKIRDWAVPLLVWAWTSVHIVISNRQTPRDYQKTTELPWDIYCPEFSNGTEMGVFVFPRTKALTKGVKVKLDCVFRPLNSGAENIFGEITLPEESGASMICILRHNETGHFGVWEEHEIKNCRSKATESRSLTMQSSILNAATITERTMKQMIPSLVQGVQDAVEDYESAQVLIESVSRMLATSELLANGKDDIMVQDWRNELFWAIEHYTRNVMIKPGQRVLLAKGHIEVESVHFPPNLDKLTSYNFESVRIPREAINNASFSNSRLLIQAYDNDLFYLWGNDRLWETHDNNTNQTIIDDFLNQEEFYGKWRILNIEFNGVKIDNLKEPIEYRLPVNLTSDYTWKCAFWHEQEKKWSSEGMTTTLLQDEVKCESTHLTAFSALIEPIPRGSDAGGSGLFRIPPIHLHILSVLSSVGSALSIAGLSMTTLTYALFRCLRKERSNKILLNLSSSLLLLHLMSVSSEADMWDGQCIVPALLLHYFLLTSLGWMLVEGVHMYQLLISVFVKPETRFLTKRFICAWGLPLILVIISALVDMRVYSAGRDDWCIMAGHLNLPLYYSTYLAPVAVCISINTFVFVRIVRVLYLQSSRTRKQQMMSSCTNAKTDKLNNLNTTDWKSVKPSSSSTSLVSLVQIKGALTVMILLGVGWTFGLLAVGPFEIVFRYFFCICNAGQGVFIFLFRVVLHPQACRTWRKAVLGTSAESELFSSSSTSVAANRKGHVSRPSFSQFSVSPTFVSASNSADNTLNKSDTITTKLASTLLKLIQSNKNAANNTITTTIITSTTTSDKTLSVPD